MFPRKKFHNLSETFEIIIPFYCLSQLFAENVYRQHILCRSVKLLA